MNSFKLPGETSRDESLVRDREQERQAESVPAPTGQSGTALEPATQDRPAWEQIRDHNWDREALQLWWAGYTCPEIGAQLQPLKAPKTIRGRLSVLRKIYGTDLIPKQPQRWEHLRKRGALRD